MDADLRLLFVANVDWYFALHHLALARAARAAGYAVTVAAADTGFAAEIRDAGMAFVPLRLTRTGMAPVAEVRTAAGIRRTLRVVRPAVVHHFTVKPVIYGTLAAVSLPVRVVNTITGLGTLQRPGSATGRIVARMYRMALAARESSLVFENAGDQHLFASLGLVRAEQTRVIAGTGVDCTRFVPGPEAAGPPVVMLAARLVRAKGIAEFVAAAAHLRAEFPEARFVLVGAPDAESADAVPERQLLRWKDDGLVEWWGPRRDMAATLLRASIVVLPSHGEGLPKVLVEAAACGRPVVASDVAGCRAVVGHGTGLLAPPGDVPALAGAIARLLRSRELRETLGARAREVALREFSCAVTHAAYLSLYQEILAPR